MCTLGLYFRVFPEYPIITAANRDEVLTRPSAAPARLWSAPQIWAGQDLLAGGTWFGINEHGVVAGILNRQAQHPPDPRRRSRGLLCLDALKYPSAQAAAHFAAAQPTAHYNPFTLVLVDPTAAYVVHTATPTPQLSPLPPGIYLFTNRDFNDCTCPRIARFLPRFRQLQAPLIHGSVGLSQLFSQLGVLLATHEETQGSHHSLCLHLDNYGTCSSTLLAYCSHDHRYTYRFAAGPPCQNLYSDVPVPPSPPASHPPSTT